MNIKAKILAGVATLAVLGTMAAPALAQTQFDDWTYDDTYDYTYDDYDYYDDYSTVDDGTATVMVFAMYGLWCCAGVLGIVNIVFFIMSLIHCIQNAPEDQKTLWIILILLVPFGAWVYFFTKRKLWSKPVATASPATPAK